MEMSERISDALSNPESIIGLVSRCGGKLPPDYRRFLLAINGGRPVKRRFGFLENAKKTESVVDWFFGDCADPDYGLIANLDVYEDRIPKSFLPIATDPFGNLILISLRAKDNGTIHFWDHEREDPDDSSKNVQQLAKNFDDFVATLA